MHQKGGSLNKKNDVERAIALDWPGLVQKPKKDFHIIFHSLSRKFYGHKLDFPIRTTRRSGNICYAFKLSCFLGVEPGVVCGLVFPYRSDQLKSERSKRGQLHRKAVIRTAGRERSAFRAEWDKTSTRSSVGYRRLQQQPSFVL